MRKDSLILVLLLLMTLSSVSGAKIDCTEKVHVGAITCTVYGEGNVSIKLLSIDGYRVSDSSPVFYQGGKILYPNSDGFYTGNGLFAVEIPSGEVISFVYRSSGYCCEKWVFYDKWHSLTFLVKDGAGSERITVRVFIDGDVLSTIWHSIKPVLPLIFIAIIAAFYKDLLEIARLATGKAPKTKPEKRETPKGPNRWLYGLTLYAILVISLYASLVILYFLGSPENMEGDFSILVPSLIATFLLLLFREEANILEKVGRGHTLKKPALTGVEIVPISLITYEDTIWLGILAFYVALFISRYRLLNRLLRAIALPLSVGWVFHILKSVRADSIFAVYFAGIAILFPLYILVRVSRVEGIPEGFSEEEARYIEIKRAIERATKRDLGEGL